MLNSKPPRIMTSEGAAFFAGNAFRRGPGKVCRNFLAGLVMLPVLEFWAGCGALGV